MLQLALALTLILILDCIVMGRDSFSAYSSAYDVGVLYYKNVAPRGSNISELMFERQLDESNPFNAAYFKYTTSLVVTKKITTLAPLCEDLDNDGNVKNATYPPIFLHMICSGPQVT